MKFKKVCGMLTIKGQTFTLLIDVDNMGRRMMYSLRW